VRHLRLPGRPRAGFDAISSIGLTEHIGVAQLPGYFASCVDRLRGRPLLNHCITRPQNTRPGRAVHRPVRVPDGS
jgi:cyclopropane-fatty-acyl-phospholipid synthase